MSHEEFFKNEAKKFLKDWKTQTQTVESDGFITYHYDWKFYDVGDLFFYYELDDKDEQDIKLARAQHYIAKMVGFKKWDELIHASEARMELSELLLRRFKNTQDVQDWEETLYYTGILQYGDEAVLDYARQYFDLGNRKEIVNLPADKISLLTGKLKTAELNNFSDENNPDGILRKDSYVFCTHCNKAFNFNQSKVIKENDSTKTMVVCKNYPNCRGTYLDFKVLSPTIMYGQTKIAGLEKGINALKTDFTMDTKVHCIHCGREYLYKEANVVQFPDDEEPLVYCKHYPECDGSLIDMMNADKTGGR
ncbi:hypothetical protein MSI_10710 [Treponema sp. JC4]|uniref:hypothetical protein n=1 Tax=Treponema sp. JC4 TaxID=1124982 RepID=UPI00025B0C29|nr:hypothetical protein [Treponema sp. JC4]EID85353.1 hypothetical protein MSI_10710 [Treponema sp. JC4]